MFYFFPTHGHKGIRGGISLLRHYGIGQLYMAEFKHLENLEMILFFAKVAYYAIANAVV